jgi:hypothetical protein
MSDANRSDNDPSMDDILASIRKIISDDEARAQTAVQNAGQSSGGSAGSGSAEVNRISRPSLGGGREDVLLLTDLIEEPPGGPAPPRPVPLPRIDPVKAAEMPQPIVELAAATEPTAAPTDPALIGTAVAGAASSAFERLSQVVKQSEPLRREGASDLGPMLGSSGKTIEEVVREMLRPMLKEWIDKNLPPLVERMVEREIVRLTRR